MKLLKLTTLTLSIACSILSISAMQDLKETKTIHADGEEMTQEQANALLHQSIERLNIQELSEALKGIAKALKFEADVNALDQNGDTPIMHLVKHHKDLVWQSIIDQGKHRDEYYVLFRSYDILILFFLNKPGIKINIRDKDQNHPLHIADRSIQKLLLKTENIEVDAQDKEGRTPLYLALPSSDTIALHFNTPHLAQSELDHGSTFSQVKLLLEHGADPNLKTQNKDTVYKKVGATMSTALQKWHAAHVTKHLKATNVLYPAICGLVSEYLVLENRENS